MFQLIFLIFRIVKLAVIAFILALIIVPFYGVTRDTYHGMKEAQARAALTPAVRVAPVARHHRIRR